MFKNISCDYVFTLIKYVLAFTLVSHIKNFYKDYTIHTHKNLDNFFRNLQLNTISWSSSSFEGYPLQVRHKQDWGRGFILLLPQTAALPGSNAGSHVIKPASSFIIQNRQTSCSMWCPMYRARC